MPCSDVPASTVDELYQEISVCSFILYVIIDSIMYIRKSKWRFKKGKCHWKRFKSELVKLKQRPMILKHHLRICGVKMPQDASSSTVRDTRGLSGLIAVCLSGT
ncbi:unnamed protein product [Prunus armeniaca]